MMEREGGGLRGKPSWRFRKQLSRVVSSPSSSAVLLGGFRTACAPELGLGLTTTGCLEGGNRQAQEGLGTT